MSYFQFPRYVSVAEKRARAEKKIRQLQKKNPDLAPVVIEGRTLARTWWGKSWNANLERYADYSNRIERGRSYVRHLAVLDLKIGKGIVNALVQGSQRKPYAVSIQIKALPKKNWGTITAACAKQLDSLQDLLAGRFPKALSHLFMEKGSGLFPSPEAIQFSCSCPDWAYMCKHVAATLYGIGVRLDQDPSLFFLLRQVNMDDLIAKALEETTDQWIRKAEDNAPPVVAEADLGSVFGIDMDAMPDFESADAKVAPTPAVTKKPKKKARPPKHTSDKKLKIKAVDEKTQILALVSAAKNGITAADLHKKSGIDIIKIRNVLYQAYRKGNIRKISRGVYGSPAPIRKKKTTNLTQTILSMIKAHPKGVGVADLKAQSGCAEKQLRNIIFRLNWSGKIRRASRGIYVAVAATKAGKPITKGSVYRKT